MSRLVVGIGFRENASAQSIGEALAAAVEQAGSAASMIAVPEDKAGHPALCAAALLAGLPIKKVSIYAMRRADPRVPTRSGAVLQRRGVGSVCEAAALAAAGAGARLIVPRLLSADRHAAAAAAFIEDSTP